MSLFFFHFIDDEARDDDRVGIEYASVEAAYLATVAGVRGMLRDLAVDRRDALLCAFEVADEDGAVLFRVDFSEVLSGGMQQSFRSPGVAVRLSQSLSETHRRAEAARNGLHASLVEVRESLGESARLLSRLDHYQAKQIRK